jgi:anti-sigma B factor antagonist
MPMGVSPARRTMIQNGPLPVAVPVSAASDCRLAVAIRPAYGGLVLTLSGELDAADTGALNAHVDASIASGLVHLVLDLKALEFCDCAGLGALLRARRLTAAHQGWARLAHVQPHLVRIIRIVGLGADLACYPSIAHAFTDSREQVPQPWSGELA